VLLQSKAGPSKAEHARSCVDARAARSSRSPSATPVADSKWLSDFLPSNPYLHPLPVYAHLSDSPRAPVGLICGALGGVISEDPLNNANALDFQHSAEHLLASSV
jgi:hypothetical protein